jgi:peptide-methionine (S)-S-oxide reductase
MAQTETITLGGGCFWCLEAVFQRTEGVTQVVSGYMGGRVDNPTYRQVCSGDTGHAEVVQVNFDPAVVSLRDILEVFFTIHDPTTLNRQGNDVGTQYRSAVFFHNGEQERVAREMVAELTRERAFRDPIVTEIVPAATFYLAEDYHQNYFNDNPSQPYCMWVVAPKVEKFGKKFAGRAKVR